ncbi:MAG: hypothetical protein Kow0042_16600 [Calditrichia bacterium]
MNAHLNSEKIQMLLDNTLPPSEGNKWRNHLRECAYCQKQFLEYEKLYGILGKEVGFQLPENFAQNVMMALRQEHKTVVLHNWVDIAYLTVSGILGFILLIYFTPIKVFQLIFGINRYEYLGQVLISMLNYAPQFKFSYVVVTLLILLIFSLLDYVLIRRKTKFHVLY